MIAPAAEKHTSTRTYPAPPTLPLRSRPYAPDSRVTSLTCGKERGRKPDVALAQTARRKLDAALSGAGHGARVLRGLDLARVLRAGAGRDLQARLAQCRAGGTATPQRQLLHQG